MRKVSVVLSEMIEAIEAARECCAEKDFEAFKHARLGRLAAERAIEILSEDARHLPAEVTERHPDIPSAMSFGTNTNGWLRTSSGISS